MCICGYISIYKRIYMWIYMYIWVYIYPQITPQTFSARPFNPITTLTTVVSSYPQSENETIQTNVA